MEIAETLDIAKNAVSAASGAHLFVRGGEGPPSSRSASRRPNRTSPLTSYTFGDLVTGLRRALAEGREESTIKNLNKYRLVIIDEIGYFPVGKEVAGLTFQLVAARYERKSTVVTTNQPLSKWGEVFSDPVIANAIIDRLVHHSAIIRIAGRSYRIKGLMDEEGADAGAADPLGGDERGTKKRRGRPRKDALGKEGGI